MHIPGALFIYQNAGAPVDGTNEVQTITPSATPAEGTFKLKFDGYLSAALDFDASAAEVQTALNALDSIGASGVGVTLSEGVYTVTFSGANVNKRVQPLITVEESSVLDSESDAVTLTVAEGTAGVTSTAHGALKGALLIDTTNGVLYINVGTPAAVDWRPFIPSDAVSLAELELLDGLTVAATVINLLTQGVASGYKIARGQHTTVDENDTVVTGLATVVSVVAVLDDDPVAGCDRVTASKGDQAGAPAAGSILIKSWKPTAADNSAPTAATTFSKKVNWIAVGT